MISIAASMNVLLFIGVFMLAGFCWTVGSIVASKLMALLA